jgi:hypothetical protein
MKLATQVSKCGFSCHKYCRNSIQELPLTVTAKFRFSATLLHNKAVNGLFDKSYKPFHRFGSNSIWENFTKSYEAIPIFIFDHNDSQ